MLELAYMVKYKPKPRHRAVAKELKRQIEYKDFKPLDQTIVEYGNYSKSTGKHNAIQVLRTKGMQQALKDEGITIENADKVMLSILNAPVVSEMITPDNQIRVADYIAKRLGSYSADKHINIHANLADFLAQARQEDKPND